MLPPVTLACMPTDKVLIFRIAAMRTRITNGYDNRYMFDVVIEIETHLPSGTLTEQLPLIVLAEQKRSEKRVQNRVTQMFYSQEEGDFGLRGLSSPQAAKRLCGDEPTFSQRKRAKQELREAIEKKLWYKLPH